MCEAAGKNAGSLDHVEVGREDGVQLFDQGLDFGRQIVRQLICSARASRCYRMANICDGLLTKGDLSISCAKQTKP